MINTVRFYRKDVQNGSFFGSSVVYIAVPATKARLQISTASETLLTGDLTLWDDNWTLYDNVNTNTTPVTHEKTRLLGVLKQDYKTVFGAIPDALLTTDDRAALRLFERKPASPIVVADFRPLLVEEEISHLLILL